MKTISGIEFPSCLVHCLAVWQFGVPHLSQPYRLQEFLGLCYPGRCPGLVQSQPFRLKECSVASTQAKALGKRYTAPDSARRAGTVLAQGNALGKWAKKHLQPVGLRQDLHPFELREAT